MVFILCVVYVPALVCTCVRMFVYRCLYIHAYTHARAHAWTGNVWMHGEWAGSWAHYIAVAYVCVVTLPTGVYHQVWCAYMLHTFSKFLEGTDIRSCFFLP
jgi:hypothetical protein